MKAPEITKGEWTLNIARLQEGESVFGFSINVEGKTVPLTSAGVYVEKPLIHEFAGKYYDTGFMPDEVAANAIAIHALPDLLKCVEIAYVDVKMQLEYYQKSNVGVVLPTKIQELIAKRDRYKAALLKAGYTFND